MYICYVCVPRPSAEAARSLLAHALLLDLFYTHTHTHTHIYTHTYIYIYIYIHAVGTCIVT